MFRRIKDWLDRGMVNAMIEQAARENEAEADPENDPWTPSLDDRRRLAVSEVFMLAEKQEGIVHPAQYGKVILHHSTGESEVMELGDATTQAVNRHIARGQLG